MTTVELNYKANGDSIITIILTREDVEDAMGNRKGRPTPPLLIQGGITALTLAAMAEKRKEPDDRDPTAH